MSGLLLKMSTSRRDKRNSTSNDMAISWQQAVTIGNIATNSDSWSLRRCLAVTLLTAVPFLIAAIRNAYLLSYDFRRVDELFSNYTFVLQKMNHCQLLYETITVRTQVMLYFAVDDSALDYNILFNSSLLPVLVKLNEETQVTLNFDKDKIESYLKLRDQSSLAAIISMLQSAQLRLVGVIKEIDSAIFDRELQAPYLFNPHLLGRMVDSYAWLHSVVGKVYATGIASTEDRIAAIRYQQVGDFYNSRLILDKTEQYEALVRQILESDDYATVKRLVNVPPDGFISKAHFQSWDFAMTNYIERLYHVCVIGILNTTREWAFAEVALHNGNASRDKMFLIISLVAATFVVSLHLLLYYGLAKQSSRASEAINLQRKYRQSLLVCLPPPLQKLVLMGDMPQAAKFKEASIVMAAIAGYERVVAQTDPTEFCKMVEDLHRLTEDVAKKYGLYIQQGLGHSFVALAGVPEKNENHASRAVNFCFDLRGEAHKLYPRIQLKFGAYAGPAIGLIGKGLQLPRYFAFTEGSVLVSYLLQIASGGDVLLSQRLYERLQQEENINFTYSEVGNVNVQRYGHEKCYRVIRKEP